MRIPYVFAICLCLCAIVVVSRSVVGEALPHLAPPLKSSRQARRAAQPQLASDFTPPRVLAAAVPVPATTGGTWTRLATNAPGPVQLMLLLSDGTVMAANRTIDTNWYRLTPDARGSYINGTWTTLHWMADTRLFYCSCVLRDGRVFVAGGEYGSGGAKSEIYDPLKNTWTTVPVPTTLLDPTQPVLSNPKNSNQAFSDNGGIILPDGTVMLAPVSYKTAGQTMIFNPANDNWSAGPSYLGGSQDEASWVKLRDDSILTINPGSNNSQRYIPSANTWTNDGVVPNALYGTVGGEIGPAFLLAPDSTHATERAFFLGGNGNTAIYTPSGTTSPGTWQAGPPIPNVLQYALDDNGGEKKLSPFITPGAAPDSAAAMMVNGKILCAFSGLIYNDARQGTTPSAATNAFWKNNTNSQYPAPTSFFEYDPTEGSVGAFTQVNSPTGQTDDIAAFQGMMLQLPDGTILFAHQGNDLFVYQPFGASLAAGKPAISGIAQNADGSYHLTGTLFNGISQGAAYGDDAQMDSNYPLVRLTDSSGYVFYARTTNWSSTGVMTGSKPTSTEFTLPAGLSQGTYSLAVVANGTSSDSIPLFVPPGEDTRNRNEKVALTGDSAPVTPSTPFVYLNDFPVLNNLGQVAFKAWLIVPGGNQGIFLKEESLASIALLGQPAPNSGTFLQVFQYFINDVGQVAFLGEGYDATSSPPTPEGVFVGTTSTLSRITGVNDPSNTPGGLNVFQGFSPPAFNNAGQAVVWAAFGKPKTSTADGSGIFLSTPAGVEKIAVSDETAPGGGIFPFVGSGDGALALNGAGQVAFVWHPTGGPASGIYFGTPSSVSSIVLQGDTAPGGGTFTAVADSRFQLNDGGQVAFSASTNAQSANVAGLYLATTADVIKIASIGDLAPNNGAVFNQFGAFSLNNRGEVAFIAYYNGSLKTGIYLYSNDAIRPIALTGSPAPDGGVYQTFSNVQLNNFGMVAFVCSTSSNSFAAGTSGILAVSNGTDAVKVIAAGDKLDNSTVQSFTVGFGQGFPGQKQFNDWGQIAYNVLLADKRHGIFLFTPTLGWSTAESGSWDAQTSWTFGLKPSAAQDVIIDRASSVTITGPIADTALHSLKIGGGAGLTELSLRSGVTVTATAGITILANGILTTHPAGNFKANSVAATGTPTLGATIDGPLTVNNGGMVNVFGGPFTVNGAITNNGIFILSSGATLSGATAFINNGVLDLMSAGPFTPPAGFVNHGVVLDSSALKVRTITKTESVFIGTERIEAAINLTIDSYSGHTYRLQISSSLAPGSFTNLGGPQQGATGAPLTFSDPNDNGQRGFYRVVIDL